MVHLNRNQAPESALTVFDPIKTLISALIIVLVGELSKRSNVLAALLLALPVVSVVSFVWLYVETRTPTQSSSSSLYPPSGCSQRGC